MVVTLITGVAVTLIQRLVLGDASAAVTGGVVGAVGALAFHDTEEKVRLVESV